MSTPEMLNITVATVLGVLALWRLVILIRSTNPTRARIVAFLLLASGFVSNLLGVRVVGAWLDAAALGLSGLVTNLALFGFFLGFLVFFGGWAGQTPMSHVRRQVVIAGVAGGLMVTAWALAAEAGTSLSYHSLGSSSPIGPQLFFLVGSTYFGYVSMVSMLLALRAWRSGSVVGRLAFGGCASGMLLVLIGGPGIRLPSVLLLMAGLPRPSDIVEHSFLTVLTVGIVLVAAGLCVIALRSSLVRLRLWWRCKRGMADLEPLWRSLIYAFPEVALHAIRHPVLDQLRLRRVHYHYRRRLVEVRDGLWRLSPYVAEPDDTDAPLDLATQAVLVREALNHHAAGFAPVSTPMAIAASLDGNDGHTLEALSRCFGSGVVGSSLLAETANS